MYKDVFTKNGNLRINDGFKRKLMELEMEIFARNSLDFFAKKGRKLGLTEMEVQAGEELLAEVEDEGVDDNVAVPTHEDEDGILPPTKFLF